MLRCWCCDVVVLVLWCCGVGVLMLWCWCCGVVRCCGVVVAPQPRGRGLHPRTVCFVRDCVRGWACAAAGRPPLAHHVGGGDVFRAVMRTGGRMGAVTGVCAAARGARTELLMIRVSRPARVTCVTMFVCVCVCVCVRGGGRRLRLRCGGRAIGAGGGRLAELRVRRCGARLYAGVRGPVRARARGRALAACMRAAACQVGGRGGGPARHGCRVRCRVGGRAIFRGAQVAEERKLAPPTLPARARTH